MKKTKRYVNLQSMESKNYANRDALFDGENGLPKYNTSIVKSFHDFFMEGDKQKNKAETILDFGAGGGHLADIFENKYGVKPTCIEIDPDLVAVLAKKNYQVLPDLQNLNQPISMIYSSNVLEHIENDSETLNEIYSKLEKNGKFALYVPALMFLFSDLDVKAGHFRRYGKRELINKVRDSGFIVEKCFYNDSLGVPASLVLKVFGYRNKFSIGSGKSLVFYDSVIYPVSQLIDKIGMKYFLGKNLYIFAVKK
jgi:SAM-dependent methyltransferase